MTKPRPEDWHEFEKWKAGNPLKENTGEVINQPSEADSKESQIEGYAELIKEQSRKIQDRRLELLNVLEFLRWAENKEAIFQQMTFKSLYKFINEAVVEINAPGKQTFSNTEKTVQQVLNALDELREERIDENATISEIKQKVGDKFDALKGIA